ncbi:MAG TPA: flagellar M-ring protein FliF [Firmicutes bacterium]|jgi:flagellar M-ring protein FliF|nr:MAG: hypothetical protein AA931_03310 [Peptococcaceae bacterium 1109]HHT72460.1 flagellar M-ring protein FliF [Bacillota bacterium]
MSTVLSSLRDTWGKLSRPMQIGAITLVLGVFALLVFITLFSNVDYEVLFANLQPEDAAAVVTALQERGTPYQLAENGTAVLVPADQVLETRIALASGGLPAGGVVGFEIFNSTRIGETEADRQLRYQWALQGELTRTIRQINAVQDARIHIVLPQRSLFIRESRPASASVLLHLRPGNTLTSSQVRAIANLVAASVEGLTSDNVTIVDSRGNVLSSPDPQQLNGEAFAARFELERAYEKQLEDNIVAMLERIYGYGNVVARVSATLDFDSHQVYSETFTPITRDGGLVRSQETITEQYSGTSLGGGVPGVDSNIPGYVGADGTSSEYSRNEAVVNYELNRTESHFTASPGKVSHLSVAVWLNGQYSPNQLASVEQSITRAIGLQPSRGDSIYVDAIPFETSEMWADGPIVQYVESPDYLPYIILGAILLLVLVVALIRRSPRRKEEAVLAPAAAGLDITVGDELAPELSEADKELRELRNKVANIAQEKPRDVAQLIRTWLAEE